MAEFEVAAMAASIEALQRVMVRLQADMEQLKAATPKAQWAAYKALELESDRRDSEFTNDR
jgi:hypothetical protein